MCGRAAAVCTRLHEPFPASSAATCLGDCHNGPGRGLKMRRSTKSIFRFSTILRSSSNGLLKPFPMRMHPSQSQGQTLSKLSSSKICEVARLTVIPSKKSKSSGRMTIWQLATSFSSTPEHPEFLVGNGALATEVRRSFFVRMSFAFCRVGACRLDYYRKDGLHLFRDDRGLPDGPSLRLVVLHY